MTIARALPFVLPLAIMAACGHGAKAPEAEPPAVRVVAVMQGSITEWLRLSGRVVPPPDRHSTLSPRVEGVLAEVTVHVGERVQRGRVLARVDTAMLGDALVTAVAAEKSAAADAEAKRRVATRTRTLLDRGVVSGEQAETDEAAAVAAESAFAGAQAARASASRRRDWTTLVAPFDGVVVNVLRQAGEPVDGTAATPVVEIAAQHPLAIALDATATVLARLEEGQDAEIAVGTPGKESIPGRVTSVAASIDPKTGTGPVRLDPATDDSALLLGRVVEARVAVAHHDAVLIVPASALRGGAGGTVETVVIEHHKAHVHTVVTGIRDGDRVEITSGLSPNDVVVVDDPVGLAEDATVRDEP